MARFLSQITLFSLAFLMLLNLMVFLCNKLIEQKEVHKIPKEKKFLVLGNSMPEAAMNDKIIEGFYNFSKEAEPYFYTFIKAREILRHNSHLEGVFIHASRIEISEERDEWTWGNSNLRSSYAKYSYAMDWPEMNLLYEHNPKGLINAHLFQTITRQLKNILWFTPQKRIKHYGGYVSWPETGFGKKDNNEMEISDSLAIQEIHIQYLQNLIGLFNQHGVNVYLMHTPIFGNGQKEDTQWIDKYLGKNNLEFEYLNFSHFPAKKDEFSDEYHLNHKGSKRFSTFFNSLFQNGLIQVSEKQAFIDQETKKLSQLQNTSASEAFKTSIKQTNQAITTYRN